VDIEVHAVQGQRRVEPLEELGLDRVVERALDGAAGKRAGVDERDPLDGRWERVVLREELGPADDGEVGGAAPVRAERARFDRHAADRHAPSHWRGR